MEASGQRHTSGSDERTRTCARSCEGDNNIIRKEGVSQQGVWDQHTRSHKIGFEKKEYRIRQQRGEARQESWTQLCHGRRRHQWRKPADKDKDGIGTSDLDARHRGHGVHSQRFRKGIHRDGEGWHHKCVLRRRHKHEDQTGFQPTLGQARELPRKGQSELHGGAERKPQRGIQRTDDGEEFDTQFVTG